jgi:hypothetical protein
MCIDIDVNRLVVMDNEINEYILYYGKWIIFYIFDFGDWKIYAIFSIDSGIYLCN